MNWWLGFSGFFNSVRCGQVSAIALVIAIYAVGSWFAIVGFKRPE